MSASLEWTDWHLCPRGWVAGDRKRDNGMMPASPPADRVLSTRYIEESNGYSPIHARHQELWRAERDDDVSALLKAHGPAPADL